jgi:DNA-binding NarL/FixJ family response regulator
MRWPLDHSILDVPPDNALNEPPRALDFQAAEDVPPIRRPIREEHERHTGVPVVTAARSAHLPRVTPWEHDVLWLVVAGNTMADVAATLGIRPLTARDHIPYLMI